jgi:protein involved in polysaccharide export with SLBB domain
MPVDGKLDLINAIALAGGLTELANPKKVKISSKGQVRVVDFKELSERGGAPILLHPDDTVTVPERIF